MGISVAVTTFNRYNSTIKSFEKVIDHPFVTDIVVLDDASTDGSDKKLKDHFVGAKKVRFISQVENVGMQMNKKHAIGLALEENVLILDSDNVVDADYIDLVQKVGFDYKTILAPQRALPNFIYDQFAGERINKGNVHKFIDMPYFGALINTCNYVVNKFFYYQTHQENKAIKGCDTAWYFYLHLKNGGEFFVVPGLQYFHQVHDGSEWLKDAAYNMQSAKEIENLLKQLSNGNV